MSTALKPVTLLGPEACKMARSYLHALLACSLLLEQLLLTANITAVAFGKHILAHCCTKHRGLSDSTQTLRDLLI